MLIFLHNLFGCFGDFNICLCGTCCPPILAARNKAGIDGRDCTICDCICCPREFYTRAQIRSQYGLGEAVMTDCLMSWLCGPCVACQDGREIQIRGQISGKN
ncbi:duf614 family protein-related [Anaeramoeba ignava]|uniref:Duf614 family protein-related n=1 Tax=Anaeramoeba ignava TaxID=1746090 RepID=A0A9Q0R846_ANAIG|nr:duf614 family protein-related [Anaeramoeba ignava]